MLRQHRNRFDSIRQLEQNFAIVGEAPRVRVSLRGITQRITMISLAKIQQWETQLGTSIGVQRGTRGSTQPSTERNVGNRRLTWIGEPSILQFRHQKEL